MKVDGIKILEGLAASGLRSIRYALEVEGTGRVDANDLDSDAVEAMKRNIQYNGPEAEQRMRPLQGDARVIMLQSPLVSIETMWRIGRGGGGGRGVAVILSPLLPCFSSVACRVLLTADRACCCLAACACAVQ